MSKQFPKPGTYLARREKPIVIQESANGALMAWLQYRLLNSEVNFSGTHSVVLGKMDGTLMTKAFENLHKIFPAWASNDPFELAEIEIPEGDGAEFELADCYIDDSYVPANSEDGAPVLQFKARWINSIGASRLPEVTPDEAAEIKSKWSGKWSSLGGAVKAAATVAAPKEKKPAAKKEVAAVPEAPKPPTRKAPVTVAKKRTSSAEEVMTLLVKKHYPNGDASEDQQQELGDKHYFPAQDKLFGVNVSAETPEQWGQVADELGL